jgi:hypothetical protein
MGPSVGSGQDLIRKQSPFSLSQHNALIEKQVRLIVNHSFRFIVFKLVAVPLHSGPSSTNTERDLLRRSSDEIHELGSATVIALSIEKVSSSYC